jgi:hypothetical protein
VASIQDGFGRQNGLIVTLPRRSAHACLGWGGVVWLDNDEEKERFSIGRDKVIGDLSAQAIAHLLRQRTRLAGTQTWRTRHLLFHQSHLQLG